MAELNGLHTTYISGIEAAERNPNLGAIERLVTAVKIAPNALLEDVSGAISTKESWACGKMVPLA
ncbi:hypothetical protein F1654_10830 [Alkalicaulis satelles]|uniref:Helix-turn-helix transcriptional regulator n=1 Tax=Alkalicaulis satelles TaxID=2609175 RepID=A0A5M6ZDC4_9PROT|nr:hypothetical protein F1654_10830 [Alkalicaulis satelles]